MKLTSKWKYFWQLLQKCMLPWTCTLFDPLVELYRTLHEFIFVISERVVPLWLPEGSQKQEYLCSINSLSQSDFRQVVELVFVSVSPTVNIIWKSFDERDCHSGKLFQFILVYLRKTAYNAVTFFYLNWHFSPV